MSFCQVIKGNDEPCKNYARYKMTCCHSHRSLENEPYQETDTKNNSGRKLPVDAIRCQFIKSCGERCKNSHSYHNKFCFFHKGLESISKANEERNKKTETFSESESESEPDDPKDKTYRANIRKPVVAKKVESLNPNGEPRCQYIIPKSGSQCRKASDCEAGFCYIHMPLGTIMSMKV
jgi:hypothetical protein